MFRLFKGLRFGNIYGCVTGVHAGKLMIYIESNDTDHGFLTTPELVNLWVPKEKFDFGLEHGILEFVKRAPKYVRTTSKAAFLQNSEELRSSV